MSLVDFASLAQILSSLAVLLTLFYLAVEVRQNTAALNAQTRQSLLTGTQTELFHTAQSPAISINMLKPGELTAEEYVELCWWLTAVMRAREFSWLQYQSGVIDDDLWETEKGVILINLSIKRTRKWWEEVGRSIFSPKYVEFVDNLLEGQALIGTDIYKKILKWE